MSDEEKNRLGEILREKAWRITAKRLGVIRTRIFGSRRWSHHWVEFIYVISFHLLPWDIFSGVSGWKWLQRISKSWFISPIYPTFKQPTYRERNNPFTADHYEVPAGHLSSKVDRGWLWSRRKSPAKMVTFTGNSQRVEHNHQFKSPVNDEFADGLAVFGTFLEWRRFSRNKKYMLTCHLKWGLQKFKVTLCPNNSDLSQHEKLI